LRGTSVALADTRSAGFHKRLATSFRMRITRVKIIPIDTGQLVAFADITIDNCFRVRDLKLYRQPMGYCIAMPEVKARDGKSKEAAYPINPKTRKVIEEAVIAEYERVSGERSR
jgi:stage V sporulation protein G